MSSLAARRVRFDLSGTPLAWVPGDPMTTAVANVLHLILPAGERWFCRIFSAALPLLEDPALRAEVQGFLRQEGSHARVHAAVLERFAALGLDTRPFTEAFEAGLSRWLGDRPLGGRLGRLGGARVERLARRLWLRHRLALVAAFEHHTCVLGRWVVERSQALDAAGADPVMMDLLRWHGAEEVEHRTVAFDAAVALGARWPERQVAAVTVVVVMTAIWLRGLAFLADADPEARAAGWRPTLADFDRAGREGRLPTRADLLAAIAAYAHPRYDPRREADTRVAADYLARSPGVQAGGAGRRAAATEPAG